MEFSSSALDTNDDVNNSEVMSSTSDDTQVPRHARWEKEVQTDLASYLCSRPGTGNQVPLLAVSSSGRSAFAEKWVHSF